MKKINLFLMGLCLMLGIGLKAQTILLSENFSTASGTTPPTGWVQNYIAGSSSTPWFFNNPNPRTITSPLSAPVAIFDSDYLGSSAGFHNVALESPSINTTGRSVIKVKFDHEFRGIYNSFDSVAVEVFNGTTWNYAYSSKSSSSISGNIDIDISAFAANKTSTKVRFRFVGDYSWWWIVDNVVIYEPCPAVITTQPKDSAICGNNNASFSVAATGTTSYTWEVSTNGGSTWSTVSNGGVYSGATTNALSLTTVPGSMNDYRYRCIAANTASSCSVTSNAVKLTVFGITSTTPGFACTGSPGSVSAVPSIGSVTWYSLASGGSNLGTGNTLNIPSAPASTTTYYAEVTSNSTGSLTQTTGTSNGQRGAMMDIKPLTNMSLTSYQWIPGGSGTYSVRIYYRVGTMVGFESSATGWNLLAIDSNVSVTTNVPITITFSSPPALTANQVYGFYLVTTTAGTVRYWNGTTAGALWSSNADLETYTGKGSTGHFGGTIANRNLGGTFNYTKGGASCPNRTGVTLTVNTPPVISTHPSNSTVCNLTNTSFTAAGTNVATYQWEMSTNGGGTWSNVSNGGVYSNATTATLDITGATTAMTTYQYRCKFTSSCSVTATTNPATLTVNTPASISGNPTNTTTCAGDNTSFSCTATGFGTLTYQWELSTNGGSTWAPLSNGGVYSNVTTATLNLTAPSAALNNNQYRCVVTGSCLPSATTTAAILTVNSSPAISTQPVDKTVCPATNTTFSCVATGTGLTYQWQENTGAGWNNISNGGIYSTATTNTLNLTGITTGMNNYRYRCIVSGTCPSPVTTGFGILSVGAAPTITTQPPSSTTICTGSAGSISLTAAGTGHTYQWQESTNGGSTWANISNGGVYSGATTTSLNFTTPPLTMSGYQYRCNVTSNCTITTTSGVCVITVANSPTISQQPANVTICAGGNASYTIVASSPSPVTYQWQGSTNGTTWTNLMNTGFYSGVTTTTLLVTNPNGNAFTIYRCLLNTGCVPPVTTNNATLTINTQPVISINPVNETRCEGQNVVFYISASGSTLTYQWEVSTNGGSTWSNVSNGGVYSGATTNILSLVNLPTTFNTNMYRCVVSGACPTVKTSTSAILTVNTRVAINTQPTANTTLCSGGSTSLTVGATGTGISYQWYLHNGTVYTPISNGGVYSGATSATLNITGITATPVARTYLYYCQVTGTCNVMNSNQAAVLVNALPVITSNPANVTRCDSTSNASFTAIATGTGLTYQWQLNTGSGWNNLVNNSTYSGVTTPTLLLPNVYFSMNGYQYRCEVTGTCAVVTSGTATLTVNPIVIPTVSIAASNTDICAGTSVTFTATPTNGGAATYQWKKNGVNVATGVSFATATIANGDIFKVEMTSNATCPSPKVAHSNQITMQVTQYVTPTIVITSSTGTSGCSGKPTVYRASITNGGPTPTYQWEVNGIPVGANVDTYLTTLLKTGDQVRCKLTGSTKCFTPSPVTSNTITMTILPTTTASIVIAANPDSVICEKTEVTLHTFFTNGGATPAYQWMLNGNNIPGQTGATMKIKTLTAGDVINCRFISSAVCVFPEISNPITFDVSNLLDPSVNVSVSFLGNNEYMFTAIPVNGGLNPSYQWYRNFQVISGETGSTYTTSDLAPSDRIYVEMTSSEDCINPMLTQVQSRITTTGVGNMAETFKQLGLYPNPNTGQFTISGELNQPIANKDVVVKITNSLGQVVYNQTYTAGGSNIKLPVTLAESIANGIYTVNIVIDNQSTNMRFMLNR